MKKLFCWSAIGLACGAVHAQSSVTLFGVVDLSLTRAKGAASVTSLGSSGLTTSRLGFRGTEDLGGGWSAGFWLEGSTNPDAGTGRPTNTNNQASGAGTQGGAFLFDRMAYVSLAGPIGEFRLGHDFIPSHYNSIFFDPFNANGMARAGNFTFTGSAFAPMPTNITASNSLSYWLPGGLGGFYGMAMVALGENPSGTPDDKDGSLLGARVGYAAKPFDVAAAITRTRYNATAALGDLTHANIGASWDAGFAKFFALYNTVKVEFSTGDVKKDTIEVGTIVPVTATGRVRFSYAKLSDRSASALRNANGSARSANDASQYGIGYVHDLSKRTALYGTYARIGNKGQAAYLPSGGVAPLPGQASSGIELGLRHIF